jgi:membrane-bound lytic murein transglycosylase D
MKILAALFFASVFPLAAQHPEVPHKMEFAGITLTIRDDARREIQRDVDALTQSPKHFAIKAERAKTYFPIIEKIFDEEQVPSDFKYLALQESALIADAVSSSNAVGFWQFKDFTAMEMGLRVDREIDERLNIVSSSRAAARYIKKNNTFFNNWIYALQAYQMGAGGVLKSVKESQSGVTHMEITGQTYWYVKRYLAHKIAYEEGVRGKGQTEVLQYENTSRKSLADLAREVSVEETELRNYNKWTKSGIIPEDRTYVVLIPVTGNKNDIVLPIASTKSESPEKVKSSVSNAVSARKKINGLLAIQALPGDDAAQLALRGGIDESKFLRWNDLEGNQPLKPGEFYFLAKKRIRASENFHKVSPGEDLWLVSQRYGVQLKKLKKYNRLGHTEDVSSGTMLWLASVRPKSDPIQKSVENAVAVSNDETFTWTSNSTEENNANKKKESVLVEAVVGLPDSTTTEIEVEKKSADPVQIVQETIITDPTRPDTTKSNAAEPTTPKKSEHLVQAGETLYGIAKLYALGVMDLVEWNDLNLQQGIKPGQLLKLYESQTASKEEVVTAKATQELYHEVKSSDTLYSIARQYSVTIKDLMEWNGKKDFSLAVGEKLKIRQGL